MAKRSRRPKPMSPKVVESAIVFWFKDADAKSENKLVEYFRGY